MRYHAADKYPWADPETIKDTKYVVSADILAFEK